MRTDMYNYNLLVSCSWSAYSGARREIIDILKMLGDDRPVVNRTIAKGVIGVKTALKPKVVIGELRRLFDKDPFLFQHTLKWVPIDLWTLSDMDSMRRGVEQLSGGIRRGERWRMTVEKRRYTRYHKMEIIRELADLIENEVDLDNPEKILRIDIIGKYAGLSVLQPQDVFSVAKPYVGIE